MKKNVIKSLIFLTASLFAAGCAGSEAVKAANQPTDNSLSGMSATEAAFITDSETETAVEKETTDRKIETESNIYPMRAGEGKKVFEEGKKYLDLSIDGVSYDYELLNKPKETDNPTLAERLYQTLYDFSVFFQYTDPYRLQYLTDQRDIVTIEGFSIGGLPVRPETDKDYIRSCEYVFHRVKYGEVTTLGEYFSRLLQTASPTFLHSDANLFEKQFVLSNGNLYLTSEPNAYTYFKGEADTRLNKIRKILSAAGETMELSFTASYEMYDLPYTEDFIVTLSYDEDYGWRVADCSTPYAVGFLVSEILEGGKNYEHPQTDLPEQIDLCLWSSRLM